MPSNLNGADAVYLGGEMFGARAYAGNFNKEELLEAIDYVHLYGKIISYSQYSDERRRTSITAGILKPFMSKDWMRWLYRIWERWSVIRKHFPKLEIHASTQMTITGFMEQDRKNRCKTSCSSKGIIFEEIQEIKDDTGLDMNVLFTEHYATAIQDSVLWVVC